MLRAGFQCHPEKPGRVEELIGAVGTLARMRGVGSTETDAQAVRLPVVGQRHTRTVETDTIELH